MARRAVYVMVNFLTVTASTTGWQGGTVTITGIITQRGKLTYAITELITYPLIRKLIS
jgi:hypothetical protein